MTATVHAAAKRVGVVIPAAGVTLNADLAVPPNARGVVVFAHGSGSSRLSPRNRAVAETLQDAGFATLLTDLLTTDEERRDAVSGAYRFDIELLAGRLVAATDWVRNEDSLRTLPIGYFGASTGAAAALVASTRRSGVVRAIVSRGGRPDMAGHLLALVHAPTLLIVGELDTQVMQLNLVAQRLMLTTAHVVAVHGATHLFEEPGALEEVARLANDWFQKRL